MPILLLIILISLVFAEDKEKKPWSVHIELSYVDTSGNTETKTLSEKGEIKWEGVKNRFYFKSSALYAKKDEEETANKLKLDTRWERLLTGRMFGFFAGGYERDKFSGYTYKWNGGSGLGYDVVKTKKHDLKVLLSGIYYYNRLEKDGIDNYGTLKAEIYYQWDILHNLNFKQSAEYIRNLSDPDTYFINTDTSLEVNVNSFISLGVGYKIAYQNKPPSEDVKRTDKTFSTSVIIDF